MKTVRQKLERQLKRIIDKFPDMETHKIHMGSKYHGEAGTLHIYQQVCSKVPDTTFWKFRNLKFILEHLWGLDKLNDLSAMKEVDYELRQEKMYDLSKHLNEEMKQHKN